MNSLQLQTRSLPDNLKNSELSWSPSSSHHRKHHGLARLAVPSSQHSSMTSAESSASTSQDRHNGFLFPSAASPSSPIDGSVSSPHGTLRMTSLLPPRRRHRAESVPGLSTPKPSRPYIVYLNPDMGIHDIFSNLKLPWLKKKRTLVISGICSENEHQLRACTEWCKSFGEVSKIICMPEGALHIIFKRADVAETVCRLNATVKIPGVGRVNLSWFSGKPGRLGT